MRAIPQPLVRERSRRKGRDTRGGPKSHLTIAESQSPKCKLIRWAREEQETHMTWWQAVPAVLAAAALLAVPGLIFSYAIGARRFMLVAMAPLSSTGLVGLSGIASGFFGIRWDVWFLAGFTFLASAIGALLRRRFRHRITLVERPAGGLWTSTLPILVSLAIPALLIGKWLVASIADPNRFSQAYDNVFHLNAIAYIVQTGNASTLTLGQMISPGNAIAIYPSAWHSLCALIVELTNVNVMVAENALTLIVCAVVWPLSCLALVRATVGTKPLPILAAGVLAAGFGAFPFQLVQRGPLFPNLLSYALLPVVIVLVAGLVGVWREKLLDIFTLLILLPVGVAALFTAQPNGFTALLAVSIPLVLGFWLRSLRKLLKEGASSKRIALTAAMVFPGAAVFALVWRALLIPYQQWQPIRSLPDAMFDVVSGGLLGSAPTWLASVLALAGVATISIRRRGYWMVASFVLLGTLYVVAASSPKGPFRHLLVGSWYEDTPRLAALVPLFTVVLAAVGVHGIAQAVAKAAQTVPYIIRGLPSLASMPVSSATAPTVTGFLVLAMLLASPIDGSPSQIPGTSSVTPPVSQQWSTEDGTLLSADEYVLLARLDQSVPQDAVIAVNPFNGGSLAYAIAGRQVTQYNLTASGPGQDLAGLATSLAYAVPNSNVCKQAQAQNIRYILDFGPTYLGFYEASLLYPGLVNVGSSPYVTLVDREGAAKLYELTGCNT